MKKKMKKEMEKKMKNVRICAVVRSYDEKGDYREKRYDNVSYKDIPKDILEDLISGEVVCVEALPNVEIYYFDRPEDWPEDWTKQGPFTILD